MVRMYHGKTSRLKGQYPRNSYRRNPVPDLVRIVTEFISRFTPGIRNHKTLILGGLAGIFLAFMILLIVDFYRVKAIANFQPNVTTKIYDKNGVLVSELFRQKREVVSMDKIPKNLIHAFVAIEDNEFYEHFGVNPKGIVRAFFINLFAGRVKQGGSTITQQLSKILLTSRKRNIIRKIKEAFIAVMMEIFYTKDEIVTLYLNQIFLGHGAYGVESASQFYFNKHVSDLTLAECAILASLPSSPNNLSPIRHPKRSMERHKIVLAKMVEMGYITIPQAEDAFKEFWPQYLYYINELPPSMNTWSARVDKAPWFTEYIRRKLIASYGKEKVYEEGLLVYTTLDLDKQLAAQEVMEKALISQTSKSAKLAFKHDDYVIENYSDMVELFSLLCDISPFVKSGSRENKKVNDFIKENIMDGFEMINFITGMENVGEAIYEYRKTYSEDKDFQKVEGCLISIDQRTGYIEALIGGSEFSPVNQLNRVMQSRRQPGSAIKPLLYSAAIESRKFTPATTILDSPVIYLNADGGDWIPENYEGEYYGFVRLRKALAFSINVISIRIAEAIGIDSVLKYYAKLLKLGSEEAKNRIPRNFSIALGSVEVSPFELARAYAIIANGGKDVIPFSIRYVKDRKGNILENDEEKIKELIAKKEKDGSIQILKPGTAQVMISLLKSVISSGTGMSASIGRPACGKTGTTNNWKDAWFVGFVPQLTTCIWVGYDKLGLSLGIGQAGGVVVAPAWGEYMRKALKNHEVLDFPRYAGLSSAKICDSSGMKPTSSCRKVISEIFIPGTEPKEDCNLCSKNIYGPELEMRGPRENISRNQKNSIMKNLKSKKNTKSILKNIGSDLL